MPGEFGEPPPLRAVARALAAFVVFPNLLFFVLGLFLFFQRGLLNLDYAVLGAAWLFLPVMARAALFAAVFILDAVGSTALMYNTHPLTGIAALAVAPADLLITVSLALALAIALALGIGLFAVRYLGDRRRRYLILAAMATVIALALALDAWRAGRTFIRRGGAGGTTDIAASSTLHFASDLRDRIISASPATYPVRAASDSLRAAVLRNDVGAENVLFISAESMGVLRDSVLLAFATQPLADARLAERYHVRSGEVRFRGGTTSGELRELCGIFADYITLPDAVLPRCLPRLLHQRGFSTYAVHGYKAQYYDRWEWYPELFDSVYFEQQLSGSAGEKRCGTQFRGICDDDAFRVVERLIRGGRRRMVYWMTLDAHTPVDMDRQPELAVRGLGYLEVCRLTPEICMEALFRNDLYGRVTALALDPHLPPTRIVVVGDHAPAFVRRQTSSAFEPGVVPFVELRPKP